jgi:hypothetical protein
MEYINLLWSDIKRGKNTSLIITIVISILLPILKYITPGLDQHIPALTLIVLALLANAMLVNRYQLEKLQNPTWELVKSGIKKLMKNFR